MKSITPYLSFGGKCREAMTFYKGVLGGELNLMTAGEAPNCENNPNMNPDHIMHSSLDFGNGYMIMATDMGGPDEKNASAITIDCDSDEELRRLFDGLKEGGNVLCEPEVMFWGGLFACCNDKYGTNWMLNFGPEGS